MAELIVILAVLAALFSVAAWWADRMPCPHTDVVDLGDGDGICTDCDAAVKL